MENVKSSLKAGFKYDVEHIRSKERMKAMGLPIEGLPERLVIKQKQRAGRLGRLVTWFYKASGLQHLNEVVIPSVVLSTEQVCNLIPTEGLNYIIGASLTGVSPISSWFIALFEANYTPVAGVTAATFTAAATECTAYDEATRVAWVPGAVSAGGVSNTASKAVFTMNATKNIYGLAQLSASAKSATTGVITSAARFAALKAVVDDDILNVTSAFTSSST
jgi:hypothetical protein